MEGVLLLKVFLGEPTVGGTFLEVLQATNFQNGDLWHLENEGHRLY